MPQRDNKVILIDPTGQVSWEYHKAHPVPPWETKDLLPGDGKILTQDTPYGRIATIICYDMDFPGLVRQAGQKGVDILFIPTNDWKEVASLRANTASLRAIESGLALVRPTSNSYSLAVDDLGRTLARSDYFNSPDRIMLAEIPAGGTHTFYLQAGDFFGWLCIAGTLLSFIYVWLSARLHLWGEKQALSPAYSDRMVE